MLEPLNTNQTGYRIFRLRKQKKLILLAYVNFNESCQVTKC